MSGKVGRFLWIASLRQIALAAHNTIGIEPVRREKGWNLQGAHADHHVKAVGDQVWRRYAGDQINREPGIL